MEFNFNWEKLSAAAGITFHNFYFRLPDAIRGPEVIDFLKALVRHIQRPLLIVWDRLPAHRSALVREFLGYSDGYIETEYLPAYAPGSIRLIPLGLLEAARGRPERLPLTPLRNCPLRLRVGCFFMRYPP